MEREEILRADFPSARKGWDPEAVRAHLEGLADRLPRTPSSLGDAAGERIGAIVTAAEGTAAEIEAEARESAERTLAEARNEAERILAEARSEAESRIEQAQAAVEGLVGQAEELRTRVGSLGEALAGELKERVEDVKAEITPPADPTPPAPAPEPPMPSPDPTPPAPEPDPEPPVPTPDPGPPAPDPEPEPTTPEPPQPDPGPPTPEPPSPEPGPGQPTPQPPATDPEPARNGEAGPASTEDLIAQLRGSGAPIANGDSAGEPVAPAEPAAPAAEIDAAAARLVAMNLALDGADAERIAAQLESEFGPLPDAEQLIGDVLARAGRG